MKSILDEYVQRKDFLSKPGRYEFALRQVTRKPDDLHVFTVEATSTTDAWVLAVHRVLRMGPFGPQSLTLLRFVESDSGYTDLRDGNHEFVSFPVENPNSDLTN